MRNLFAALCAVLAARAAALSPGLTTSHMPAPNAVSLANACEANGCTVEEMMDLYSELRTADHSPARTAMLRRISSVSNTAAEESVPPFVWDAAICTLPLLLAMLAQFS